jgi:hypothetical protein
MIDAATTNFATRTNRSQRTITVDNFLRKVLRVSDPRDPQQIANALLSRYPEDAERDLREREGLSYAGPNGVRAPVAITPNAGIIELETARTDLERDLQTLTSLSQLKDISVELTGWGRAIRQAASDGLAAARLALDSVNHDTAMSARRMLCEYARLARFVGTMSDGSGLYFRRLAQSCDVLAALILVGIGEGLAASGITRSTAIVRVAASDLQTRRNAVITALRGLIGSVDATLQQDQYPRGILGYQSLRRSLEAGGQADLVALLEENTLSAAMDQLVDLTTGASVAGLRELSTTASMLTHRFARLVQYGRSVPVPGGIVDETTVPESPPLLNFVAALQLFVDAFTTSGSSRLLYLARPPILSYGLYSTGDNIPANRLTRLAIARGNLASAIDCFAGCGCANDEIRCIVMFDFVLSMVDRAIDLYAVGTNDDGNGEAEHRAIASGLLALRAISFATPVDLNLPGDDDDLNFSCELSSAIRDSIDAIEAELVEPMRDAQGDLDPISGAAAARELRVAYAAERQIETLVRRLASGCANHDVFSPGLGQGVEQSDSLVRLMIRRTLSEIDNNPVELSNTITIPYTSDASASAMLNNTTPMTH